MWIVDARGAASVAFATSLTASAPGSLVAVPTFNNWPADEELVPAEETLAAMVFMRPRLPAPDVTRTRPVFVLDSWRLAYKTETIDDDVTDNRYMLSPADFPSPEVLAAQGITQVIYVVEALDEGTMQEEDDLHELFTTYSNAGITITMVDLASLAEAPVYGSEEWFTWWGDRRLIIVPRATVVTSIHFYARARGGFGGVHGAPHFGHVHFGGHGGG
jgi:hypothetical protein